MTPVIVLKLIAASRKRRQRKPTRQYRQREYLLAASVALHLINNIGMAAEKYSYRLAAEESR